jgi:hypothetical protein
MLNCFSRYLFSSILGTPTGTPTGSSLALIHLENHFPPIQASTAPSITRLAADGNLCPLDSTDCHDESIVQPERGDGRAHLSSCTGKGKALSD